MRRKGGGKYGDGGFAGRSFQKSFLYLRCSEQVAEREERETGGGGVWKYRGYSKDRGKKKRSSKKETYTSGY